MGRLPRRSKFNKTRVVFFTGIPLSFLQLEKKERGTMASTALRQLISERDKLQAEMEALRNKVEGLEIAIKLISDDTSRTSLVGESRPGVTDTLVELLRTAGENGLKPREAIELAEQNGKHLNRGSVYSLLNRMERTGVVVHENARYKLTETLDGAEPGPASPS
jgi:hypothetical protein